MLIAAQRPIPEGVELVAQGYDSGFVEAVDPTRALRLLSYKTCVLQYLQVLGHRGSAHWQVSGKLAHWLRPFAQAQDDRSPCPVGQRRPPLSFLVSNH